MKNKTVSCLRRFGATLILGAAFMAMPASAQKPTPLPALQLLNAKRPLVIAHRGYSQFAPENTLPAFQLALRSGADLVELDYYHSADGQMVVFHDTTLDRTTDAVTRWGRQKIPVVATTAADMRSLDAGSWFSRQFTGVKVPLLTEALDVIQGGGGVTLIERKSGDAASCAALLAGRKLINEVIVQAFDWQYLQAFHELQPTQVLGALGPPSLLVDGSKRGDRPKPLDKSWLDLLKPTGAQIVVWNREVSRPAVRLAHRRGLKVWVYTINEPELAHSLLDMGVDGIITDNPSLIWRALAVRGR